MASHQITLSRQAYDVIVRESLRVNGTETGGVLLGFVKNRHVVMAGGPGSRADLAFGHFTSDPEHDQRLLAEAKRRWGGSVQVLGWWHLHPKGMPRPSGGDLAQAKDLLCDYWKGGDRGFLLSIITQCDAPRVHARNA
jgi:integrative and conjugative element protein (TIGR02256 family)